MPISKNTKKFLIKQSIEKNTLVIAAVITFFIVEVPVANHIERLDRINYTDKKQLDAAAELYPPLFDCVNGFKAEHEVVTKILSLLPFFEEGDERWEKLEEPLDKIKGVKEKFQDKESIDKHYATCGDAQTILLEQHFWIDEATFSELDKCISVGLNIPAMLIDELSSGLQIMQVSPSFQEVLDEAHDRGDYHAITSIMEQTSRLRDAQFQLAMKPSERQFELSACQSNVRRLLDSFKNS